MPIRKGFWPNAEWNSRFSRRSQRNLGLQFATFNTVFEWRSKKRGTLLGASFFGVDCR